MSKAVLVTGASGEIGKAICQEFAKNGYDIAVHYFSDKKSAENLCAELESIYNVNARCYCADFSKQGAAKALAEAVQADFDVNVLVNNAGTSYRSVFQLADSSKVRKLFEINTQSALELTKYILPSMIREQSGAVINISSMWGVTGGSCEVHYSTSKAALIGFTKALCKEVGPSGITVNCIAPGMIDTKMNAELSPEDVKAIAEETPLGRIGTPKDVAALAVFLAGKEASFITGQVICVDGGLCV